ncbi:bifunctional 5,10-methylenetetrahydrofolate dehydrogenase/5,10-methenyltetrahydrofolate cyclohydrolase [Leadbettera azotonutricia]|uniref:Bifunctional protein FolD n=1 Tax=Leadbettera azotonutricia (strain ATCC BAA-888 / DSM 13862 / ZAS-9) TaxID=545695 RepID=F5Y8J1_LEAAZ|nr:bifunctional 5,10-methylene-tetrahydrofolate dehydrogenase/5,10-methylene-tetrahydrofolate cyclohydrolase [Leadbettera azotonutricia]AEF81955.1 bifunctional protein FolD [Leadbettera azotonutricia ZAS-9]
MAEIIDGKAIAEKVREDARIRADELKRKGIIPCLAVILAGEDPASLSYVTGKEKALAEAGMESRDLRLSESVSEAELLSLISTLNADPKVHGILVQLPLPRHIDSDRIITAIDPAKDVDGFHPVSVGNLVLGKKGFIPCTPNGVVFLLKEMKIKTSGAHAVILGRSSIVGKPLANLLIQKGINATVTICHTGTPDFSIYTRQADILIAAAGSPGLVKGNMIKPGAAVIDVGVNRVADAAKKSGFRLRGDVDFESACETAGWITPVPGGVGPMTIAMLMLNVVEAASK